MHRSTSNVVWYATGETLPSPLDGGASCWSIGERAFHKGIEDSLQRLKRAAEEKVQDVEIRKAEKGTS